MQYGLSKLSEVLLADALFGLQMLIDNFWPFKRSLKFSLVALELAVCYYLLIEFIYSANFWPIFLIENLIQENKMQ